MFGLTEKLWQVGTIVLLGALLGFGAYHVFEVAALKGDNASKQRAIAQLAADRVALAVDNAVLHKENSTFAKRVEEQNAALEALKKERDEATKAWMEAARAGAVRSKEFMARIAAIEAARAKEGEAWHETWLRLLDGYFAERKTP